MQGGHQHRGWFGTPEDVKSRICASFLPIQAPVYIGMHNAPPAFYTVATGWAVSVYGGKFSCDTLSLLFSCRISSPGFYPMGSDYVLAEETYRMGLVGITDGEWLRHKLIAEYGMEAYSVGCSFDRRIYFSWRAKRTKRHKKLFFTRGRRRSGGRSNSGVLILAAVKERMGDVEFVLAGAELDEYVLPFPLHRERHSSPGSARVRCIGIATGSRALFHEFVRSLPLELMACGVPVVSNRGPNTEWLLSDASCCLVRPRVAEMAEAICRLLVNDDERSALREAGLRKAQSTSWEDEGDRWRLFWRCSRAPVRHICRVQADLNHSISDLGLGRGRSAGNLSGDAFHAGLNERKRRARYFARIA
jgi:hypothetical protein